MYRSFMITSLLRRSIVGLGLVVLLPSCTLTNDTSPESVTSAIVQPPDTAREAAGGTSQATGAEHKIAWEGLIITVPAQATLQPLSSVAAPATNGLPLIAAGTITYPTPAPDGTEWYGPRFILFQFDGSAEEWLALERQLRPQSVGSPRIRVIEESVQPRTIAGSQGLAYRFDTGVQDDNIAEHYAVKLAEDQLLVIVTLNVENPTYQSVIDSLQRQ